MHVLMTESMIHGKYKRLINMHRFKIQVAERALYMWNNEQFVKMASQSVEDVFPILVEGMEKNLKYHWSKSVKQLTQNVKEMLEELDPGVYLKCLSQLELQESAAYHREMRRKEMWERVEMAACKNQLRCIRVSN